MHAADVLQPVCIADQTRMVLVNIPMHCRDSLHLQFTSYGHAIMRAHFVSFMLGCRDVLSSMTVALGTSKSKFSAAVNSENDISVSGTVKGGTPYLTAVGSFDVDLAVEVRLHALLCATMSSSYSAAHEFHKSTCMLDVPFGWWQKGSSQAAGMNPNLLGRC